MISNFREFYKLAGWLRRFRLKNIRMIIGALTFCNVLDKRFYTHLRGGILEAFGKLFIENLKVYIYPGKLVKDSQVTTINNMPVPEDIRHLFMHLIENQYIVDIPDCREEILPYFSHIVLSKIKDGDPDWESMVPRYVSAFIKSKKLFGYEEVES